MSVFPPYKKTLKVLGLILALNLVLAGCISDVTEGTDSTQPSSLVTTISQSESSTRASSAMTTTEALTTTESTTETTTTTTPLATTTDSSTTQTPSESLTTTTVSSQTMTTVEPSEPAASEEERQIVRVVNDRIASLPMPGGDVHVQSSPPAASAVVQPVHDPYWQYDDNETRRSISFMIAEALDQGLTSVDIAPALEGMVIADEAVFKLQLDALVFTVKEGNPKYFYYNNMIHTYYYYYDVEGGRTYVEYLVEFTIKPEYEDVEVREREWALLDLEADAVARAIMDQTESDWQRLRLAHDYLTIKNFYSPTADVSTNNVVSGLRGDETMCVGYAQAFQMIANRMGYPTYNIYGYANGEAHDWNIVLLDGSWYHVDVTFDDPINNSYPAPMVQTSYFLRSETVMSVSHRIDSYNVPQAPNDFLANYIEAETLIYDKDQLVQRIVSYLNNRDLYDEIPDVLEFYTNEFTLSMSELDMIMTEVFEEITDVYPYYFYLISGNVGTIYFTFDV